jgi:ribose 1,5-bisphosphokinase
MLNRGSNITLKIILIVGPSGAGKDSLLQRCRLALADRHDISFIPRYVTRIPDINEQNYYIDQRAFSTLKQNGFFFVDWQAHGNFYGVSVEPLLEKGKRTAIISVSRSVIPTFEMVFDDVHTLLITAPSVLLRARLERRGRESIAGMNSRFTRMELEVSARRLAVFDNGGSLDETTPLFLKLVEKIIISSDSSQQMEKSKVISQAPDNEGMLLGNS